MNKEEILKKSRNYNYFLFVYYVSIISFEYW